MWNKILWVDIQLGCLHQIYHGPKEMLMASSLSDTGNMGPVWVGLILKNLKQNPAFWVSFELTIRPQIFINYIQHFYLARLVPLQHWGMSSIFHVDYNKIISNQFVGFLIHALKAIKKYDLVPLLSVRSEVVPRKSDTMLIYVLTRDPFSKINLWAIPCFICSCPCKGRMVLIG